MQLLDMLQTRAWNAIVKPEAFRLIGGKDYLKDYQFGSHSIHHLFCEHCGVHPLGWGHLEDIGGDFYSVNLGCLDDANLQELASASVQFCDGPHDNWQSPPAKTRQL